MALTRVTSFVIADNAITSDKISAEVSLGVKIANVQIANSSYTVLDDTAVDVAGGYIIINGAGFSSGAQVLIEGTAANSVTFVSSSQLKAQIPAASAGSYNLYVVNTDGSTGIRVNGVTYSATPTWVTSGTLDNQAVDVAFNVALDATGAVSYANSTVLPAGTDLLSNGYFYGTVTGIVEETTYNFTVVATDTENQDSPRTFSVTVTVGPSDQYFNNVSLLLLGDGTQDSTNIIDSSSFNESITIVGSARIRTDVKKYGTGSLYIPYNTDGFQTTGLNLTGDFTIEGWVRPQITGQEKFFIFQGINATNGFLLSLSQSEVRFRSNGQTDILQAISDSAWYHFAVSRSGSSTNNTKLFYNGTLINQGTYTNQILATTGNLNIGVCNNLALSFSSYGYIDDFRITNGIARYTSNFTPPTEALPVQ